MGAGASLFKRQSRPSPVAEEKSNGDPNAQDGEVSTISRVDIGSHSKLELHRSRRTLHSAQVEEKVEEDEDSDVLEGVEEIMCRIAQAHHSQTPNRWDAITKKVNGTMKEKTMTTQPLKVLLQKEGLGVPQCWVKEMIKAEQENKEKLEQGHGATHSPNKGVRIALGGSLFVGDKSKDARGEKMNALGESETEPESEPEEGGELPTGHHESTGFTFVPLTKYEVFSYMRRLHHHVGQHVLKTAEALAELSGATEVLERIYSDLPAEVVRGISQQARIGENIGDDTLAYGEINLSNFLEVLVKMKRVHGHMMTEGGSYWDLGAGTGKTVIAAAVMHDFEVFKQPSRKKAMRVDFIYADAMKREGWIQEASVLFVHTNFSATDMEDLRKKADSMKVGSLCLSVSLPAVREEKWGLLAVESINTSWGPTKLYAHEKLAP